MTKHTENGKLRYRFEPFGGIIASEDPPFLAFVDRDYMLDLGTGTSELWQTEDNSVDLLSAPTEVHFAITNRCNAGCAHCYMDGGEPDKGELDTDSFKRALDVLAQMGVFHVAMGGGEALERDDLFPLAHYARDIGLVPNLTVSGRGITPEVAQRMTIFGQVNISLDRAAESDSPYRPPGAFAIADQAFDHLRAAGVSSGINCVVGRGNFDSIPDLFKYAKKKGLNEIEFLRFKPSGRGKELYLQERTTHQQNIALTPMLAKWSRKTKITAKIDCSFVPMYCYHKPPKEVLYSLATYGCEAGNVLLGVRSDGSVSGCSFLDNCGLSIFDLPEAFANGHGPLAPLRSWLERASEPCLSCDYLDICKGGCHGVSQFISGDYDLPDPDCPIVREYQKGEQS
jgi:radical SAM protein with 4Fe4S-binding SPASM domain